MIKITKKNIYEALIKFAQGEAMEYVNKEGQTVEVTDEELIAFAQTELKHLAKKNEAAKATAAKKRETADALQAELATLLTDTYETASDIALRATTAEATVSKCVFRLNELVKAGVAEKDDIKIKGADGKTRTVKGFRAAKVEPEVDEEMVEE